METKRKLEFKDIARYMPYGLIRMSINTNVHAHSSNIDLTKFKQLGIESNVFLPILRPISDLYKKITHNGKKMIPIIELAKISKKKEEWELYIANEIKGAVNKEYVFSFTCGQFVLYDTIDADIEAIRQTDLFDWLDEHLFDYRGLIDAGLAVDVNTLEENPYK